MKSFLLPLFLLACSASLAQDVKVEYDKSKDFSGYKTFMFGESEVITPKEKKQISDAALHKMICDAIRDELKEKSITENDSTSELLITYVVGSFEHSERQDFGPLGVGPGSSGRMFTNNYSQGEMIIDINDIKTKKLIWRIKAQTTTGTPETKTYISQIVDKGLKKFAVKPKTKKR